MPAFIEAKDHARWFDGANDRLEQSDIRGRCPFVPGFRGACHRAALRADPLAPSGLRFSNCDKFPGISRALAQTASAERHTAKIETIQGFNIRRWSERGLNYWAISDLAADELADFGEKFESALRTSAPG
jgi:hypothetical protein